MKKIKVICDYCGYVSYEKIRDIIHPEVIEKHIGHCLECYELHHSGSNYAIYLDKDGNIYG